MKTSLTFSLVALCVLCGCLSQRADVDAALAYYRQNELERALPMFEALAREQPSDTRILAYLAETYRRTGEAERAVETARRALALDPCNAFAHCTLAEAMNPLSNTWSGTNADSTWAHLLRAAECDTVNGTPWLMIWGESIRRGEKEMTSKAARRMIETGFFAPALLAYTRWVLAGLPQGAIVLTNGDMDTYPVAAIQEVELVRPDVVLANRGTLNEPWYARYLRDVKGVALPFTDAELEALQARQEPGRGLRTSADQIIAGWLEMDSEGRLGHPVVFANTTPESYRGSFRKPLQFCGAFTAVIGQERDRPNVGVIASALAQFSPEDFFGPWVSDQDRSPVRITGTKNIVRNVTHSALTLAEQAAIAEDVSGFERWLSYARKLDTGSALGPVYADRIQQLEAKGVPPR